MVNNGTGIVIDTNVIISSLVFGGKPKQLIEKVVKDRLLVFTSPQLVSELLEVLRKKFNFSEEKIQKLEKEVLSLFKIVYPTKEIRVVRDVSDNKVIETAIESKSTVIISGDKDLISLRKYQNILILNPTEFLDTLPD